MKNLLIPWKVYEKWSNSMKHVRKDHQFNEKSKKNTPIHRKINENSTNSKKNQRKINQFREKSTKNIPMSRNMNQFHEKSTKTLPIPWTINEKSTNSTKHLRKFHRFHDLSLTCHQFSVDFSTISVDFSNSFYRRFDELCLTFWPTFTKIQHRPPTVNRISPLTTKNPQSFTDRQKFTKIRGALDAAMQSRSSFYSGILIDFFDPRPTTTIQRVAGGWHPSWAEVPRNGHIKRLLNQNSPAQPRDMGRGTVIGSNTPWAQGPASSYLSCLKTVLGSKQ